MSRKLILRLDPRLQLGDIDRELAIELRSQSACVLSISRSVLCVNKVSHVVCVEDSLQNPTS
jgi:hypothetical protein